MITKMELKIPIDANELTFECEWETNVAPTVKRTGPEEFSVSLDEFITMWKRVGVYIDSIAKLRST